MKRNYLTRQADNKAKKEAVEFLSGQENDGLQKKEIRLKKLYLALPYI